MTTTEVATHLVRLCNARKNLEAIATYYAPDIASFEASGPRLETRGKDAVRQKNEMWLDSHDVHSARAEGPWVNGDHFAVEFTYEMTPKAAGSARMTMNEVAVYTVRNGMIVEERFFQKV